MKFVALIRQQPERTLAGVQPHSPTSNVTTTRLGSGLVPVFLSVAATALVAWGTILLVPEALFWDDWVIANDDTLRMTSELGIPWVGYIMTVLFALGPWSFKVLVITSTIAVGWLVYGISGSGLGLSRGERWGLAALVVSLPLFEPRALASVSTYSWSLALFMAGWYLLVRRAPSEPGRARYIVASLLLFASYSTGSLLPLTAFAVAHLALLALSGSRLTPRALFRFVGRFWFVIAAPIVFWVVRTLYLEPYGLYEDYNTVGPVPYGPLQKILLFLACAGLAAAVVLAYRVFAPIPRSSRRREALSAGALSVVAAGLGIVVHATRMSTDPDDKAVPILLVASAVAVAARAVVLAVTRGQEPDDGTSLERDVSPLLAVGIALFVFSVVPYLLVGKLPTFQTWEARHQLIMPLGAATIAVAGMRSASTFLPARLVGWLTALLVALMATIALFSTVGLVADWRKQAQIIAALEGESLVRSASTVVFEDDAPWLNWDDRTYPFYEYTGWMQSAYGDQSRLGLDESSVVGFLNGEMDGLFALGERYRERYGVRDYVRSTDGVLVQIRTRDDSTFWSLVLGNPVIELVVTPINDLESLR